MDIFVHCKTQVKKSSIRREVIDGVEHIIVNSKTLPDNIVMNGGLYPAEEINKSYQSLERTFAPIGHPVDDNGGYLPASDPVAIHNFHGGAYNKNVRKDGNRISIDKVINVQEASKTERGKRLLDRLIEIETNDNARPIHTSVGLLLQKETLEEPMIVNGQSYNWIARNMNFDHDAILLDDVGAAQPSQGVGIAVNGKAEKIEKHEFIINDEIEDEPDPEVLESVSHEELRDLLFDALNKPPFRIDFIDRVFPEDVVYMVDDQFFKVPYRLDNGIVTIVGIPQPVERDVTFTPKTNQKGEDMFEEMIVNALKDAKVNTEGMTQEQILDAYNKLQVNNAEQPNGDSHDDQADVAEVVANAIKPLAEEVNDLKEKISQKESSDHDKNAETVVNSANYPGLDLESAKLLPKEILANMAATCTPSVSIPVFNHSDGDNSGADVYSIPE